MILAQQGRKAAMMGGGELVQLVGGDANLASIARMRQEGKLSLGELAMESMASRRQ